MIHSRSYGVLLHISSLSSPYGVGDFGPEARRFLDVLADAGARCWQVLPLSPTRPPHYSPYSTESAFALNPIFASPDDLVEDGLIDRSAVEGMRTEPKVWADYDYAMKVKEKVLLKAFENSRSRERWVRPLVDDFFDRNYHWLRDYALFRVIEGVYSHSWSEWPEELRDRSPQALERVWSEHRDRIDFVLFEQYVLWRQWSKLRHEARARGISILGDVPYYVDHDSADVWASKHLFKLDRHGRPLFVGGVPPDRFSSTGQLWGMPTYSWENHLEERFRWWVRRLSRSLELFDIVRLDHFRGFVAYWEVPAGSSTAAGGRWVPAPYEELFKELSRAFPSMPFIAEDLGLITPDVREAVARYGFPSMRVLIFAFSGSPNNEHLPHNYRDNTVVLTSTHDTNTVRGWFEEEAADPEKDFLRRYIGSEVCEKTVSDVLTRLALSSTAGLTVIPVQDILGLGSEARMNRPGRASGNWLWRLLPGQLTTADIRRLREWAELYSRV